MNIRKNMIIIAIVFIMLSGYITYSKESTTQKYDLDSYELSSNGRIAILIDSKWEWSNGFPQTDYLGILREITSALDYLGYKYDILNETVVDKELYPYELLITIVGNDYMKIVNFSEKTGRVVLILYAPSEKLLSKLNNKGKGWTDTINMNLSGNACIKSRLTDRAFDDYGIFSIFKAYNIDYGSKANVLCKTEDGIPLLIEQFYNNGHYIFLPTRDTTWKQYNYNLIDNIIRENTRLLRVGSIPYAQDIAVIVRLDDFTGDYEETWSKYLNVTRDISIAAVMNKTSFATLSHINGDILPHGFNHEDLSILSYSDENLILSDTKEKYFEITGNYPRGYVSPYNRISENTTTIGNNLGFNFFTTYFGMANMPRHYYKKISNDIWILGDRSVDFSNETIVKSVLGEYSSRGGVVMLVDHPYEKYNTGSIDNSLRTLTSVTEFVNNHDGYYLTTLDDFFQKLVDTKYVTIRNSKLTVEKDINNGLTLYCKKCIRGIKVDNIVMMYYRNNLTILPSMKKGEYQIEYIDKYPVLRIQGGFVKNAIFDTITNKMTIVAHSSTDITTRLDFDKLEPSSRYHAIKRDNNSSNETEFDLSTNADGSASMNIELIGGIDKEIEIFKRN